MGTRADQVAALNTYAMGPQGEWDAHGNFMFHMAQKADDRIAELEAALRLILSIAASKCEPHHNVEAIVHHASAALGDLQT